MSLIEDTTKKNVEILSVANLDAIEDDIVAELTALAKINSLRRTNESAAAEMYGGEMLKHVRLAREHYILMQFYQERTIK